MLLGKVSPADIRLLLTYLPILERDADDCQAIARQNRKRIFARDCANPQWCHLYELSALEHIGHTVTGVGLSADLAECAKSPNPISAVLGKLQTVSKALDQWEPSVEEREQLRPNVAAHLGIGISVLNTLRSLMAYGVYLNDLIAQVRAGDDASLMKAVRIDATVIGCPSVVRRVSEAALEGDHRFVAKLKNAIGGKLAKQEQANFRKMRLVLRVLHDTGAGRLSDDQLYDLFVKELDLYPDPGTGDPGKALRKFADQYMKKAATT